MNPETRRSSLKHTDADSLVGQVADEFLDRLSRGERPNIEQYISRYPQVASVLREVLPALEVIGGLGAATDAGVESATGRAIDREAGRIGDFRIIREVGRGGMGVVYEAEQISLGRRVALKVLPFAAAMDERHLQRFRNEAQAAAHLQHQNIVPVYAVGCERGVHYYAMQFVEGRTLAEVIRELRELNADESPARASKDSETSTRSPAFFRSVTRLAIQAAEALEHAHQLGVVHRDIKPANLLVDARQNLWITDFGLAQVHADTHLTITGDLLGTLRYMSPEQALAKRVIIDHRTDIYSLGATLYELMTLRPVFDGTDRQDLLRQIAFEEPESPRQVNPAIPIELDTIVMKCLSKNPDERFGTARELADDLQRFQRDEPIRARRPTVMQRLAKWSRRHPAVIRSLIVILLIAVAALAVSTILISKAKRQAEAREAETRAALDFVQNKVFAAARPAGQAGGLGRDVTLRQALEAALPFVETSFTDQPLIEARLRMTLAVSFWYLGEGKRAAEQSAAARAIRAKHLGPDHPDTLHAMTTLANDYHMLGRYDEALSLREETLALQESRLGLDHIDTLRTMNNLANSYAAVGRHDHACKLREQTVARMNSALGLDHPVTLAATRNLANNYSALGRYHDAIQLQEQTLARLKAKFGNDHPDTLGSTRSLAGSYANVGRLNEAVKLEEGTLAIQQNKLGHDHPETLLTMNNLAETFTRLRRHAEALKLREQVFALRQTRFGSDHPDTLLSMSALADSYLAVERHGDAIDLFQRVVSSQKSQLGSDHPATLLSMHGLASCYYAVSRYDDAVKLHEQTLALRKASLGAEHPSTVGSMQSLASSLAALGRHDQALRLREEALALWKTKFGPEHSDTADCLRGVAESLVALDRATDAEPLLLEALRILELRGVDMPELIEIVKLLAAACDDLGKPADAARWRSKLDQLTRQAETIQPAGN